MARPTMSGLNEPPNQERIYSPAASIAGFGKAEPATNDTERPFAPSLEADLEGRLAELTEVAIISRSLARQ